MQQINSVRVSKESVAKWTERLILLLTVSFAILLLPALTVDVVVRGEMTSLMTNLSSTLEGGSTSPRGKSASIVQGETPQPEDRTRARHPTMSLEYACALVFAVAIWAGGRLRQFGQDYAGVDVSRARANIMNVNIPILNPTLATP